MFGSLWQTASLQSQSQILIVIFICLCVCMCVSVFWYLVLASVPVVEQACRDQKGVVLMAVLAIVPATVVANLCLSSGKSNWMLTPWQERHLVNTSIYFAHIVSDIRVMFVIIGHTEDYWSYFKMGGKSKNQGILKMLFLKGNHQLCSSSSWILGSGRHILASKTDGMRTAGLVFLQSQRNQ